MKGMIFAIDFDGTCVTHAYPDVGVDIGAEPTLKRIVEAGGRLVLNTMRSGHKLEDAVLWFDERSIPLYGIQFTPKQNEWTSSTKVYAHVYIDDAALGCPTLFDPTISKRPFADWEAIEAILFPNQE